MNVSPINANFMTPATSFGCSDPNCKCQAGIVSTKEAPKDTLEITQDVAKKTTNFGKKVVNGAKKTWNFLKTNKKQVLVGAKAAFDGVLTACTVVGANELMQKVSKQNTASLAGKIAIAAGVAMTAAELVKNRNAFMNKQAENK